MKFDVNVVVHNHCHGDDEDVLKLLREIKSQGVKIMALLEDLQAAIAALNAETTLIGERIAALLEKLANESLSAEQKAGIIASIQAETDRLKTLAANPADPVPDVPPALMQARRR